ncbi:MULTISPECIES: hypothetical protein [Amycolatopsis]|uniref:Transposase n=1 Tax=Amycolatopsis bullii TaxID=941987 RepID=A0ABQ3KPW8_9PSEU|nr:hypothetical protein GCM10017567_75810 [Amycolatopsis bullii]
MTNDVTQLISLIDIIPTIRGAVGRPRRLVRARGITPLIARHGAEHGSGVSKVRWPADRTSVWLRNFRRLSSRTGRRADVQQAVLGLACSVICLRKLILH